MRAAVGLAVWTALALQASAQTENWQPQARSFEVASVRPSPEGARGIRFVWQPDRLVVASGSLRTLIMSAYPGEALGERIEGGPDWLQTARFDINAVIDPAHIATREQRLQVLRAFLADRFTLVLRRELREQTVYALVIAREDRALGSSLWPSELDCDAPGRAEGLPLGPEQRPACGTASGTGLLLGGNQSSTSIAQSLSLAGVPDVRDGTGLEGTFDFVLRYTPGAFATSSPDDTPAPEYPVIFTALQEQLGLKLEPTRGQVPYFVVEHAEWPSLD